MDPDLSPPTAPPAGWYPDPHGTDLRWWDGSAWTQHVQAANPPPASVELPPLYLPPTPTSLTGYVNRGVRAGRSLTGYVLLILLAGLTLMFVATLAGASSATAEDIAAKVIVYGGFAFIGLRLFITR